MITIDNLKKIQRRSALKARDFVDTALEFAAELGITIPNLPTKNRTLPKLLAHFTQYASEADLLRTTKTIITQYSRAQYVGYYIKNPSAMPSSASGLTA